MALALVYIDFVTVLLNQGLTSAIVQREDLRPDHLESAFWGNMAFGIVLATASFAFAPLFAGMVHQAGMADVLRWLSLAFVLHAVFAVQDALLRRQLRFRVLALRTVLAQLIGGAVGIVFALQGGGIWSLVALHLMAQAIGAVLLWSASDWRPRFRFSLERYRELFTFGVAIMGLSILIFWRERADHFLIGAGLGATALGFYSMGRQVMQGVTSLASGAVGPVVWSMLSRLQREPDRLVRAMHQAGEMLAVVTWPVYLGIAAIAPEFVTVILGDRWLPIVPLLRAFVLAALASGLALPVLLAVMAVGEARWRLGIEMIVTTITLLAVIIALPFGMIAVAWAFAGSIFLTIPLKLRVAARVLPISVPEYLARYVPPAVASIAMLAAVVGIKEVLGARAQQQILLASLVAVGALVYAGFLRLAFPAITRRALDNLSTGLRPGRLPLWRKSRLPADEPQKAGGVEQGPPPPGSYPPDGE
jgi:O-antigen/teichoic acid export membrane protein